MMAVDLEDRSVSVSGNMERQSLTIDYNQEVTISGKVYGHASMFTEDKGIAVIKNMQTGSTEFKKRPALMMYRFLHMY